MAELILINSVRDSLEEWIAKEVEFWSNNDEHEVVTSFEHEAVTSFEDEHVAENELEHPNPKYKKIFRDYISMPVILISEDEFEAKVNHSTKI